MLKAIRAGKIDCVVVKDFSRFGRGYVGVGNYLEHVFPLLNVRFVSVNDCFDSAANKPDAGLDAALKTLVYDLYSKDLSVKVKTALQTKMKRGEFISPFAPYGYVKQNQRNGLEIDPEAAQIVRQIFASAAAGHRPTKIARELNSQGVLPPSSYKAAKGIKRTWGINGGKAIWRDATVHKILRDERYTGAMVGHKRVVVPNTHEAIVPKALFDGIQSHFKGGSGTSAKRGGGNALSGLVRCHHCNRALRLTSPRKKGGGHYICPTTKLANAPNCLEGGISEKLVSESVSRVLRAHTALFEEGKKNNPDAAETRGAAETVKRANARKKELYEAYKNGRITKESYFLQREQLNKRTEQAKNASPRYEAEADGLEGKVDAIIIYDARRLEIKFTSTPSTPS